MSFDRIRCNNCLSLHLCWFSEIIVTIADICNTELGSCLE